MDDHKRAANDRIRERAEIFAELFRMLRERTDDERLPEILRLSAGLDPYAPDYRGEPHSLREIADKLDISKSMAHKLRRRAIDELSDLDELLESEAITQHLFTDYPRLRALVWELVNAKNEKDSQQ